MKRHVDHGNTNEKQEGEPENKVAAHDTFQFHKRCGDWVSLHDNSLTAEKTGSGENGFVISSVPMEVNVLYQVDAAEIDDKLPAEEIYIGVVTESPDAIQIARVEQLTNAVVVSPDAVYTNGVREDRPNVALKYVKDGSIIGVLLDTERFLHVIIDGRDLGRVTPDQPLSSDSPVHALFDVSRRLKKIKTQPLIRMAELM